MSLMLEMAYPRHHHGDAVGVGGSDAVGVTHGASGLSDSRDPGLGRERHAVVKGEEGIAGEYGALELEAEVARLLDGLLDHVDGVVAQSGERVRLGVVLGLVGLDEVLHLGVGVVVGGVVGGVVGLVVLGLVTGELDMESINALAEADENEDDYSFLNDD